MTKIKLSKRPAGKQTRSIPAKTTERQIAHSGPKNKSTAKQVSIGIADDHTFIREALRNMLDAEESIRVVGEADNGRKAVEMAVAERPDVMLMDIGMPRMNGLEAARQIRQSAPGVRVVLLSAFGNDSFINQTMLGDFDAYLLKDSPSNLVLHAIQEVVGGRKFFSPSISHRMRKIGAETPSGNGSRPAVKLTSREIEVLQLIAEGYANKQIAGDLEISIKTVEKHRQNLMDKLHIHETASLTRYAISSGVIDNAVQTLLPL
jgi:DNA-binding NarL/FixJ family response regulator